MTQVNTDISKLVETSHMEKFPKSFLFEPQNLVPFEKALNWQRIWQEKLLLKPNSSQAVWLLEHENCYTLGRGASESNLLFDWEDAPYPLYRIDRGGEVTYHTPGQLVVYPVLNLIHYKKDLNWYLRQLEEAIIDVLKNLELPFEQINGLTGLWVNNKKVASLGIGCRRWITQHGLSININCDLSGFDKIIPCGLTDHKIGNLNEWLPGIKVQEVKLLLRNSFRKRFSLDWIYQE